MNRLTQYVPTFVDRDGSPLSWEFGTTEELLALEWVSRWRRTVGFDGFYVDGNYLMVGASGGYDWWVLGILDKPERIDLPPWPSWKFYVAVDGGEPFTVAGKEIISVCGDVVTLKDGRKATRLNPVRQRQQ